MMPDYRAGNPYQSLLAQSLEELGVSVSFANGYRRGLPLWRAASQSKADLLHLHWLNPYLKGSSFLKHCFYSAKLLVDLGLVRLSGSKVVWTAHNQVSHESQFPATERLVQRCVALLASSVVVHSESARKVLIQSRIAPRADMVRVIPHGHYGTAYSAPVQRNHARQVLGWGDRELIFLYFGMIRPYKNLEGLISAWSNAPQLFNRATLVIAGAPISAEYGKQIQSLASRASGIDLHLHRVPDDQIHLYFSAADVVVLPFLRILTSGSLLLAVSFGKPVVAPRFEAIKENLCGADQLLYDPEDSEGLRSAMEAAANPETNLDDLSQKVRLLCQNLGWDRIAALTADVYSS